MNVLFFGEKYTQPFLANKIKILTIFLENKFIRNIIHYTNDICYGNSQTNCNSLGLLSKGGTHKHRTRV